jgi:hypothetical protein
LSKSDQGFFVSLRLNLIIAIGYSFAPASIQYSVLAICTRCLKNHDLPRGYGYPFSLQDGCGNKYGHVLYAIPLI